MIVIPQKGISPLIAVIVLIALTMIVAGIIATFTQTFTQRTFEEITSCSAGSVLISGASYNTNSSGLTVVIRNTGDIDLNFIATVTFSDRTTNEDHNYTTQSPDANPIPITAGQIHTTIFTPVTTNITQVNVQSVECSGSIQDFLGSDFIVGLGA